MPKFAGWMATYGLTPGEPDEKEPAAGGDDGRVRESTPEREGEEDAAVSGVLPPLAEGDRLEMKALRPEQKFTQPPPRFSEATLVKELEENGIGRPSTYASIISVLQDREYANKNEGRFKPTLLGTMITELLTKSFDDIIDIEYTRNLEDDLDKIEQGKTDYVRTLTSFYKKFKKDLARAGKEMIDLKKGIEIGEACDKCGLPMLKRVGKFGPFIACSGYPECTNTRELETSEPESESGEEEIEPCENCGKPMAMKRGRFGQFLACTGYPECKTTRKLIATKQGGLRAAKADQILDEKCPALHVQPRRQAGPLRRVHGVHELSRVQVHQAQDDGRQLPQGRRQGRRGRRAQVEAGEDVLRLFELSRLRLRALEPPDQRAVPEVRRAVSRREDHQEARTPGPLQQRGVRLRALRSAARNP